MMGEQMFNITEDELDVWINKYRVRLFDMTLS